MESAKQLNDDVLLNHLRSFVTLLGAGNRTKAEQTIEEPGRICEQSLFCGLGKMSPQSRDLLTSFILDARIWSPVESDIPDANDRLNHVITRTEDSAKRIPIAAEGALSKAEQLHNTASPGACRHGCWRPRRGLGAEKKRRHGLGLGPGQQCHLWYADGRFGGRFQRQGRPVAA